MHPTRIFKDDKELEKAWEDFKEEVAEQSKIWQKVQYVGKIGERKSDAQKVPLTLEGFKRYCWKHHGDVSNYFDNSGNLYNDFKAICTRIRNEIREDQIVGAMLGFYNPSITQRLNNLVEKTSAEDSKEVTVNVKYERKASNDNAE